MATGIWQPGLLYIPGSLVRPRTASPVVQSAPDNGYFEEGDTGWDLDDGLSIGEFGAAFEGTFSLEYDDTDPAVRVALNDNAVPVRPGQSIQASCQIQQGASSSGQAGGFIFITWYSAAMAIVGQDLGNSVQSGSGGQWKISNVTGVAPAGAAFAKLGIGMFRLTGSDPLYADLASWDYVYSSPPDGLIFKAVQAVSGFSGSAEPVWPVAVGLTVIDNEVTWEAVLTSRVVYEAHPILKSGSIEPTFPTDIGGTVADGTIIWEASSRQITDARCPHSKYVVTGASKIFAGDEDIIPFSATNNPLDWSTKDDAGFLPFGLQRFGGSPVRGLGLYRSNLVAFNVQGAQMWQIDEDPQNMALLDAVPVGSQYHRSIQPVANDLAFLTDVGIRNFGIAAASTNLQAGDFAKPIDPLVKAEVGPDANPIGLFYPGTGQYMLFFGLQAFVLTFNGTSSRAVSRSRYELPSAVDDWTLLDGVLYLRSGDLVWRYDEEAIADDQNGSSTSFHFIAGSDPGTIYIGYAREDFDATVEGSLDVDYEGVGPFELHLIRSFTGEGETVQFGLGSPVPIDEEAFLSFEIEIGETTYSFEVGDATSTDLVENEDSTASRWRRYWNFADSLPLVADQTYLITIFGVGTRFDGYIAWPYLDLQAFGDDVMLHGFDLVGTGEVAVSFGYNQKNLDHATEPYTVDADTLNGMPIAMPIKAPSVQLRLTFSGTQLWSFQAARLYDSPVNT